MATPTEAIETITAATGLPAARVSYAARHLRDADTDADLWPKSGRGGGKAAARVSADHLVNLLLAVMGCDTLTEAPEVVNQYRALVPQLETRHKEVSVDGATHSISVERHLGHNPLRAPSLAAALTMRPEEPSFPGATLAEALVEAINAARSPDADRPTVASFTLYRGSGHATLRLRHPDGSTLWQSYWTDMGRQFGLLDMLEAEGDNPPTPKAKPRAALEVSASIDPEIFRVLADLLTEPAQEGLALEQSAEKPNGPKVPAFEPSDEPSPQPRSRAVKGGGIASVKANTATVTNRSQSSSRERASLMDGDDHRDSVTPKPQGTPRHARKPHQPRPTAA